MNRGKLKLKRLIPLIIAGPMAMPVQADEHFTIEYSRADAGDVVRRLIDIREAYMALNDHHESSVYDILLPYAYIYECLTEVNALEDIHERFSVLVNCTHCVDQMLRHEVEGVIEYCEDSEPNLDAKRYTGGDTWVKSHNEFEHERNSLNSAIKALNDSLVGSYGTE